jgi:DNA-binding NarL/FixJ family response regulator
MQNSEPIRIVIVDDDLVRDGYFSMINDNPAFNCAGNYSNCEDVLENLSSDQPEVILMELALQGTPAIKGIRSIRKRNPSIDIIVFTILDDDMIFQAICAGAKGYINKNVTPSKLMDSIKELYNGQAEMSTSIARMTVESFETIIRSSLTEKETEVLLSLANGNSYSMIADKLKIDKNAVKTHIKNIYQKLNLNSKAGTFGKAV